MTIYYWTPGDWSPQRGKGKIVKRRDNAKAKEVFTYGPSARTWLVPNLVKPYGDAK